LKHLFYLFCLFLILPSCRESGVDKPEADLTGYPEIDAATEAIRQSPSDPLRYYARAEAYNLYEGYDPAIRDLKMAISLDSQFVEAYHLLADTYLDYYNSRMAMNTMYHAAQRFPTRIPTLLKLTEYQYLLEMNDGARMSIDRILTLDPLNGDAYFWRGMIHRDADERVEAIRAFQKATELDPFIIDAWIECGKLMAKEGRPLALRFLQNAIQLDSLNPHTWHALAEYYQDLDMLDESLATYRTLIGFNPYYADAFLNSGLIYFEMDSLEQARKQFDLALKVDPAMVVAWLGRGNTFELEGDLEAARSDYEQVLRLEPGNARAMAALEALDK
jgi:tetratricopeptide (TPR) repeat protein